MHSRKNVHFFLVVFILLICVVSGTPGKWYKFWKTPNRLPSPPNTHGGSRALMPLSIQLRRRITSHESHSISSSSLDSPQSSQIVPASSVPASSALSLRNSERSLIRSGNTNYMTTLIESPAVAAPLNSNSLRKIPSFITKLMNKSKNTVKNAAIVVAAVGSAIEIKNLLSGKEESEEKTETSTIIPMNKIFVAPNTTTNEVKSAVYTSEMVLEATTSSTKAPVSTYMDERSFYIPRIALDVTTTTTTRKPTTKPNYTFPSRNDILLTAPTTKATTTSTTTAAPTTRTTDATTTTTERSTTTSMLTTKRAYRNRIGVPSNAVVRMYFFPLNYSFRPSTRRENLKLGCHRRGILMVSVFSSSFSIFLFSVYCILFAYMKICLK